MLGDCLDGELQQEHLDSRQRNLLSKQRLSVKHELHNWKRDFTLGTDISW